MRIPNSRLHKISMNYVYFSAEQGNAVSYVNIVERAFKFFVSFLNLRHAASKEINLFSLLIFSFLLFAVLQVGFSIFIRKREVSQEK